MNNEPQHHDPDDVRTLIRQFLELEARDPVAFRLALIDNIEDPVAEETEAFRSEPLAFKAYLAAEEAVRQNAEQIVRHKRDRNKAAERGAKAFGERVERERRILEAIVIGIRARGGILPTAPNPRRRAERRLVNEAMRGSVPEGRWRELLEEEKQKIKDQRKQQKKARRASRRD